MRADRAVEPTRSENITVTWRRSAASCGRASAASVGRFGATVSVDLRPAMARRIFRRSPRTTPRSFRSWSVTSGRTEINAVFSKTLSILGHAEFFEPICNLLHRPPLRISHYPFWTGGT